MNAINNTLNVERAPIVPQSFSQPFWDATREKKLLIQYDKDSNKYQFYPRANSRFTGKRNLEWREVEGKGEVYSFTIVRRARPPFTGHEPFFLAVVSLPEGVQIMGNTVNCSFEQMKIGLKVKPYWHPLADGTHMLMWQLDQS